MKADTEKKIPRTAGDTDPILVRLTRRTDAGDVAVGNAAVVQLRAKVAGATVTIAGTARGDGSGVFAFEPVGLPEVAATVPFAIAVTEGGDTFTIARGTIQIDPAI